MQNPVVVTVDTYSLGCFIQSHEFVFANRKVENQLSVNVARILNKQTILYKYQQ